MLCFLCSVDRASRYIRVKKTNLIYYVSSVYFVTQPLHVSDILVAHHQEVYCIRTTIGTCFCLLVDCRLSGLRWTTDSQLKSTTRANCIYTVYLLIMVYKYSRNM